MIRNRSFRLPAALSVAVLLVAGCQPGAELSLSPDAALEDLFERVWEFRITENPMFATSVGDLRFNDQLGSVAPADLERRAQKNQEFLDEVMAIDLDSLSEEMQINVRILERQLWDAVELHRFGEWQMPLTAETGFHSGFARLGARVPLRTTKQYEDYISRLEQFRGWAGQHTENMRAGIARGWVLPRVVLEGYEETISAHIVDDPEESVLYGPFKVFPSTVPEADHERLRAAGRAVLESSVVPGYREFFDFFVNEYLPACSDSIAASDRPGGEEYYAQRVKFFTTLNVTPQEVHDIGLAEVARIKSEMLEIMRQTGFDGDFDSFLEFLRTDPQFYAKTPEELLREASYISKRMDAKLPMLFNTLPRLPYGVAPVPDHIAPKYTAGRYVGPPEGSTQPGYYWVNTFKLDSRPLYALTALSLHEAVPGHHLQTALAREKGEQPKFRRHDYISAFGEGWGLYSEFLGIEAELYDDLYSHFGRLTYEMWRACRLVVDTGMHSLGWSRQDTLRFLSENTALSIHEITTETDRYISWPGQALSYKMGEIKIRELRKRAEERLGTAFDVRDFHDWVLENGSVPLDILDDLVDAKIEAAAS
ncbi:MAG: DUF885 domain-containing protein [Acidobacteriota bacterium]